MTYHTNKRFENTTMVIEGKTIRWEDHMIQITNISQVWLGNCIKELLPIQLVLILFFIALSGAGPVKTIVMLLALIIYTLTWSYWYWKLKDTKDINLEVSSGDVYSFVSHNEEFTCQVYDLIRDLVAQNSLNTNLCIRFNGDGKIIDNSIKEKQQEKIVEKQILNIQSTGTNNQITMELQKLAQKYAEKKESNGDIIDIIEKTIKLLDTNDKQELKKCFSKFIMMGLINDCNELGLYTLTEVIKNSVY